MSFQTFISARDSVLRNAENANQAAEQDRQRGVLTSAGEAYATGDMTGARNALARGGEIGSAMTMDANQRTQATADRTSRIADEDRARSTVLAGAQGLLILPEDQWMSAFSSRIAPALLGVGIDQGMIDQISQDGITRQEVEYLVKSLGGEVESPWANDRAGPNGSVIRPGRDGYSEVSPGAANPRDGIPSGWERQPDGSIAPMRGYTEGRSDIAGATRAPPRGRAGGGRRSSGGGGSAAAPINASGIRWD